MTSVGQKDRSNVFGREAPSRNLRLPKNEVITVAEFFTYFPNSTRNYNFLRRFVPAGIDQRTIANIVNLHRKWEKWPAEINSVCKLLSKEFQENFDKNWSIRKHNDENLTYGLAWGAQDLTLKDVLLACEVYPKINAAGKITNPPMDNIPFADLAINVVRHPSYATGDGFMLTRCVQYAEAQTEKGYMFPRDFTKLVRKLQDGRVLEAKHYDNALILRWKNKGAWVAGELRHIEAFPVAEDSNDEDIQESLASDMIAATTSRPVGFASSFGAGGFQVQGFAAGFAAHPPFPSHIAHTPFQGHITHTPFQGHITHTPFQGYTPHPPYQGFSGHLPYQDLARNSPFLHDQGHGFIPQAANPFQLSLQQDQSHSFSQNGFRQPTHPQNNSDLVTSTGQSYPMVHQNAPGLPVYMRLDQAVLRFPTDGSFDYTLFDDSSETLNDQASGDWWLL
ncbi:hypothetical protein HBI75_224060 [Parastagonospora nodorum]|nr:hypothetical protein HBI75_224060 [Parastagonospora nodorum]KAH5991756.1 hypothetical protein HBI84_167250 [Parastagonospora nodorum]